VLINGHCDPMWFINQVDDSKPPPSYQSIMSPPVPSPAPTPELTELLTDIEDDLVLAALERVVELLTAILQLLPSQRLHQLHE